MQVAGANGRLRVDYVRYREGICPYAGTQVGVRARRKTARAMAYGVRQ